MIPCCSARYTRVLSIRRFVKHPPVKHSDFLLLPYKQVSANTGRIHLFKVCPQNPGNAILLQVNTRPEDIQRWCSHLPEKHGQTQENGWTKGRERFGEGMGGEAVPPLLSRHVALLRATQQFASQWKALKPRQQRKLLGRILTLPIADELEFLYASPSKKVRHRLSGGESLCIETCFFRLTW